MLEFNNNRPIRDLNERNKLRPNFLNSFIRLRANSVLPSLNKSTRPSLQDELMCKKIMLRSRQEKLEEEKLWMDHN